MPFTNSFESFGHFVQIIFAPSLLPEPPFILPIQLCVLFFSSPTDSNYAAHIYLDIRLSKIRSPWTTVELNGWGEVEIQFWPCIQFHVELGWQTFTKARKQHILHGCSVVLTRIVVLDGAPHSSTRLHICLPAARPRVSLLVYLTLQGDGQGEWEKNKVRQVIFQLWMW